MITGAFGNHSAETFLYGWILKSAFVCGVLRSRVLVKEADFAESSVLQERSLILRHYNKINSLLFQVE